MVQQKYVPRNVLLNELLKYRDTPNIKIITGVRRCGKSTLMTMLADKLLADGIPESNIFHMCFDDFDLPLDYDSKALHSELRLAADQIDRNYSWYVLLDEIQNIDDWELVVRRLRERSNTDVYLTGSNARLLSSDLATHLTGRYTEIKVYPLSFSEFVDFVQASGSLLTIDSKEAEEQSNYAAGNQALPKQGVNDFLNEYLLCGGMPGLFEIRHRNQHSLANELSAIYQSIVYRDVAQRFGIRDIAGLDRLSKFIFTTAGSLFSVRNVANTLSAIGHKTADTTVANQIHALEQAFLVYGVEQTGLQGKVVLRPQKKYYPVDLGFVGLASGFSGQNIGARLECAVALELIRRAWQISIGAARSSEIDFVAIDPLGTNKEYIQVCAYMRDEETRKRELLPLRRLTDSYPRTVITLDPYSKEVTEEGIQIIPATEWLMNRE